MGFFGLVNRGWRRLRALASAASGADANLENRRQPQTIVDSLNQFAPSLRDHAVSESEGSLNQQRFHRIALSNRTSLAQFSIVQILIILLIFNIPSFATISSLTNWEIRTTGSNSNGGGFVAGASGTDRSQSDTAFCTSADLAVVTTTATSVACPFSAASVGNIIQITAGGCSAGFYQVVSVTVVTATLDSSAGTASGCTFALGGGLQTIQTAITNTGPAIAGNTVWIKAGTYTITTKIVNPINTSNNPFSVIGYQVTHGDNTGTRPLITTATNSTHIFDFGAANSLMYVFQNLSLSNTAGTPFDGFHATTGEIYGLWVNNCLLTGFRNGIDGDFVVDFSFPGLRVTQTEITATTTAAIINSDGVYAQGNYIHDNTGSGFIGTTGRAGLGMFLQNVFYKNANGIVDATTGTTSTQGRFYIFQSNVFSDQTTDGINLSNGGNPAWPIGIENNIFYNNGVYGFSLVVPPNPQYSINNQNNAYGANGTAPRLGLNAGTNDVTLSADPFVARGAGNFALNSTAGGGTALKATGYPGIIPSAGTGYLDIGALQSQCTGGGGGSAASCAFVQ